MCKTVQDTKTHRVLPRILIFSVVLLHAGQLIAQDKSTDLNNIARLILAERGEIQIRFVRPAEQQLEYLTLIMSIDRVNHDTISAYVNRDGYEKFTALNIPFEIIPAASLKKQAEAIRKSTGDWRTHYPSYARYLALMDSFALKYSDLCHLTEMATTPNGHKLLVMKITSQAGLNENKPAVLLTSSIHGDEPLGYVLMLRLIETLLNQYGASNEITTLIDRVEIWINPLANPDGTFFVSDSTIYGATRFNANQVDLNRNFPDPEKGEHPDSYNWQTETVAMMNFMKSIHPVLSANIHGGAELINYPWDSFERLHPDDSWFREISRSYADTAQAHSYSGYMTAEDNGITNGYNWYPVYGGRQDYVNYYLHGREVTMEISENKIPDESTLENYWKYNFSSLLHYMEAVYTGISGNVTDSVTGMPVKAVISIPGHDRDNSQVYADSEDGHFYRFTTEGNYVIDVLADSYVSKRIPVQVQQGRLNHMDIKLSPLVQFLLYPNPFSDVLRINVSEPGKELGLEFTDLSGRKAMYITKRITSAGLQEIRVDGLAPGMYIVNIIYGDHITREAILKIR